MKSALTLAAATVFLAFAGPAFADPAREVRSVRVSYADLDLSQSEGRATFARRLQRAVVAVCPDRPMPHELNQIQEYRACVSKAGADARRQMAEALGATQVADSTVHISTPAGVVTAR